jgi:hypothetical protein
MMTVRPSQLRKKKPAQGGLYGRRIGLRSYGAVAGCTSAGAMNMKPPGWIRIIT